jgi:hypothetical protein
MFRDSEVIEIPDDENTKIWRYVDFAKFVSILEEKTLFFVDYKQFDDPAEGCFPYENIIKMSQVIRRVNKDITLEKSIERAENHYRKLQEVIHGAGDYFINCWHMNNEESLAMWKLYSDMNKGIAIQSTFKNLNECLSKSEYADDIAIGIVKYTPSIDWSHECTVYRPFMHKRRSFNHEQEIRAVIFHRHDAINVKPEVHNSADIFEDRKGISIPVNLDVLIDKIYISPKAHRWFGKLVRTLLDTYELGHKEIVHSSIYDKNLY